jgi:hypothetical protein
MNCASYFYKTLGAAEWWVELVLVVLQVVLWNVNTVKLGMPVPKQICKVVNTDVGRSELGNIRHAHFVLWVYVEVR